MVRSSMGFLGLLIFFSTLFIYPSLSKAQSEWDKLKSIIRNIREKGELPSWSKSPHYRRKSDLDAFQFISNLIDPPKLPDIDPESDELPLPPPTSLSEMRYGDLTDHERDLHDSIINSPFSPKKVHIPNNLYAHGIEHQKGGIKNLINIMIEGRIFRQYYGPLKTGDPSLNAGNHGPFFILIDPHLAREMDLQLQEAAHMGYLVPGNRHRLKIIKFLTVALQRGLLKWEEKMAIEDKILTYEEFVTLAQIDPKSMGDASRFRMTLKAHQANKKLIRLAKLALELGSIASYVIPDFMTHDLLHCKR